MKMTEEYILSILNGEETLENTKLLNIRYVVEPELKDGLTINDISSEYDYNTIWNYYDIIQMIENIATEIESLDLDKYYLSEHRRSRLAGFEFEDVQENNILSIIRIEDDFFVDNRTKGVEVNWKIKGIYINDYKFDSFDFDKIFDHLNSLLADGKLKSDEMWWD